MKTTGIFAGIGGFERGFEEAGIGTGMLCEIEEGARRVLRNKFAGVRMEADVRMVSDTNGGDVVAAGFPCQNLSQCGRTEGIRGDKSWIVAELFRLLKREEPKWVVMENVPFMLKLGKGEAIEYVTRELEKLGFDWAYRVVDGRCFGVPQRRKRLFLVASRTESPMDVLLADEAGEGERVEEGKAYGFYWTEGLRGLGWTVDGVPPLKGGSGVGIPSPPAVWVPSERMIGTPDLRDAERLQGFSEGWTTSAVMEGRKHRGKRWKLVGNAVCVQVSSWIGERLQHPRRFGAGKKSVVDRGRSWPTNAWNEGGVVYTSEEVSEWPVRKNGRGLMDFLRYPIVPLSNRATRGFHSRAIRSNLRFREGFLEDVVHHMKKCL